MVYQNDIEFKTKKETENSEKQKSIFLKKRSKIQTKINRH